MNRSDVAFLEYKEQCKSDLTCMKKLKAVLRYQVSNIYTKRALLQFMGDNGQLDPSKIYPKVWPGVTYGFKTDGTADDGFNVVMGMPGGKGVAFLLVRVALLSEGVLSMWQLLLTTVI